MSKIQEIEDKIERLIGESGNDDLMAAWLEYLAEKKSASERIEKRLSDKDPVLTGAIVGAFIGALFTSK